MDRMRQMDDEADKSVLQDIIDIMGKMNGDDMDSRRKSYAEVKLEEPVDMEGAGDSLKAEVLPGEEDSVIPETESLKSALQSALDEDSSEEDDSENDFDSDSDLRRKARIF